jgi:chorismate synthase
MLRYLTAGESHGRGLLSVLEGLPSGLKIDEGFINAELKARQSGHGRGARMKIETDRVEIWTGIKNKITLGSPLGLVINNKDFTLDDLSPVTTPRPGHADLAGAVKYAHRDIRNVLERSSARETAARVALGAIAQLLLAEFGIRLRSWILSLGGISAGEIKEKEMEKNLKRSLLNCPDPGAEKEMIRLIDKARKAGDTLGGVFQVTARGVPPGLGNYSQASGRLDAVLGAALMSIPAVKAVEVGLGFAAARMKGSQVHDEIFTGRKGIHRATNRAGGIEGGISNGEEIILRAAMKPIPTLGRPLRSVDLATGQPAPAARERADVCVLPAASVVGRGVMALALAQAFLEKFGGDSLEEIRRNYSGYMESLKQF